MVEKGQLARKFLSTYHSERWPVAQKVLEIDRTAAKSAAGHKSSDYCDVVEHNRLFTAGYGIQYECNEEDMHTLMWNSGNNSKDYVMQPGMRAPNYKVFSFATGKKTRLFDAIVDREDIPKWMTFTLFVMAGDLKSTHDTVSVFLNETSKATTLLPPTNVVVVTTSTADQVANYRGLLDSDRVVIDKLNQAQCHRAYHRKTDPNTKKHSEGEHVHIVVVRPDGYIGTIIRGEDGISLSNKVCQYFSNLV